MAMPIGSMTKQFTAVAVMLLAEGGKLSVSDPITRYLPKYPTHGKTITIENLLTHTSGIPDYATTPDWPSNMGHEVSTHALLDTFSQRPLDFEPGAKYEYSNSNYILLVERACWCEHRPHNKPLVLHADNGAAMGAEIRHLVQRRAFA
jgi:CubicO group peptidase (beta-lactamase class C family)